MSAATHHMNVDYSAYGGSASPDGVKPSCPAMKPLSAVIGRQVFTGRAGRGAATPRFTCQYLG